MRRGEVWWVDFDPSVGGETQKTRPALVVSRTSHNTRLNRVQVIPLTSNTARVYSNEATVSVNGVLHKASADQIKTVSKLRVKNWFGRVSPADLIAVELAIKDQLALKP